MDVKYVIELVLFVPTLYFVFRYFLHMFQLNGYRCSEFVRWVKRSDGVWFLPIPVTAAQWSDWIALMCCIVTLVVFFRLKRTKRKKPLVLTARAMRLIITEALLIIVGSCYFGVLEVFSIAIAFQPIILMLTKLVNSPLEWVICRYYTQDAKRILKSNKNLKVIGITGSYGKTSTKFYLETILKESFNVLVTPESYNTPMGVVKTIRSSLKPFHEIFVCEMGARYRGDIKELCDIVEPDYGVITSIDFQHLETFKSMEQIIQTKFELADAVKGTMFLNEDNDYIRLKAKEYDKDIVYFSELEGSGYYAKDVEVSNRGTDFILVTPDNNEVKFHTKLIGAYNVDNVVCAISVAHQLGVSMEKIRAGVKKLKPVEHRMQLINRGDITIVDDAYNSNPVGSKAAVQTLAMFDGLHVLITPGMVELGEKEKLCNWQFGRYAARYCDYVLLVGRKRAEVIQKGLECERFPEDRVKVFSSLEEAMSFALGIKTEEHKYVLLENDLPDNY